MSILAANSRPCKRSFNSALQFRNYGQPERNSANLLNIPSLHRNLQSRKLRLKTIFASEVFSSFSPFAQLFILNAYTLSSILAKLIELRLLN